MRLRQSDRFRSTFYAGRRWRRLRWSAIVGAGFRCEGCGRLGQKLEVHHVEPVSERSSEAELYPGRDGLQVLCWPCHRTRHRKPPAVRGLAELRNLLRQYDLG